MNLELRIRGLRIRGISRRRIVILNSTSARRLAMNWGMLSLTIWIRPCLRSAIRNPQSAILFLPPSAFPAARRAAPARRPRRRRRPRRHGRPSPTRRRATTGSGRRYYNANYKFWGYIRRPRETWKSARLVVLNEQSKFAPDRALNQMGIDNNSEYKIQGRFTGETIYESASNAFYPEFVRRAFSSSAPILRRSSLPIIATMASRF